MNVRTDDPTQPRLGRRPRLLVLGSTLPKHEHDGTPAFVGDLAHEESEVFDTTILVPHVPGAPIREVRGRLEIVRYRFFFGAKGDLADGAILENLRARPSRWLQVLPLFVSGTLSLRRIVRQLSPDLLHVHWIIPQGVMALVAARQLPWVVTTLGGDLYALRAKPLLWLKARILRRAAAVTVMNEEMRQIVLDLGVAKERVHVMPMGVVLERQQSRKSEDSRVDGRLVFVGRLVEKKGLSVLLDALRQVHESISWSLDIVGDGPLRAELEIVARPLGNRVVFHGQQTAQALAIIVGRAQLAVFPSVRARSGDQDGLPVALLEAMASGAPVVVSDLPGLRDAVCSDGQIDAGIVVPPGNAEALGEAIVMLLTNGALRLDASRAAVARASAHSSTEVGERYRQLLMRVVIQQPR